MLHSPEILPECKEISLITKTLPLSYRDRREMRLPVGASLHEIVNESRVRAAKGCRVRAWINGVEVPCEEWYDCVPAGGSNVSVALVPSGGKSGAGKAIITIIVGILLVWVAAPLLIAGAGFGAGAAAGAAAAAGVVSTAGVGLIINGSLSLIMSAFSRQSPLTDRGGQGSNSNESPTFYIRGTTNQVRLYSPVPTIYGIHKMTPDYAAQPFTDVPGGNDLTPSGQTDAYSFNLFDAGYGPRFIEDIKIGGTDLTDFTDYFLQTRFGFFWENKESIYSFDVATDNYSVLVSHGGADPSDGTTPGVEYIRAAPLPSVVGPALSVNGDSIYVTILFDQGLLKIDDKGQWQTTTVRLTLKYRIVGEIDWIVAPGYDDVTIEGMTRQQLYKVLQINGLARGNYEINISRGSGDLTVEGGTTYKANEFYLNSIRYNAAGANPVAISGLAQVALKIKATAQLNGTVDQLNFIGKFVRELTQATEAVFYNGEFRTTLPSTISANAPRTMMCWAKAASAGGSGLGGLIQWGEFAPDKLNRDFSLRFNTTEIMVSAGITAADIHYPISSLSSSPFSGYHHYAASWDGSFSRLYFDGLLIATSATAVVLKTPPVPLRIGAWYLDASQVATPGYFDGSIYDAVFFSACLSDADVAHYKDNFPDPKVSLAFPNLFAAYRLNEGSGKTAIDFSPGANHLQWRTPSLIEEVFSDGTIELIEAPPAWRSSGRAPSWTYAPSQNPADAFLDLLQGPGNPAPLPDSRIDLDAIAAWRAFCATNGFAYNVVIDFSSTLFERLQAAAQSGRASFTMSEGRFSVLIDGPKANVIQYFSPRNSISFQGEKTTVTIPHALIVKFVDETNNYIQGQRTIFASFIDSHGTTITYTDATATIFDNIEIEGITHPDLIHKFGRYYLANMILRQESFTLDTDIENLICTRGDRVRVAHDVPLIGIASGRVVDVALSGDGINIVAISMDEEVTLEEGKFYQLIVRDQDAVGHTYNVQNDPGITKVFILDTETTYFATDGIGRGDLCMFGERERVVRDMVVRSISPGQDFTAKLLLVDYNEALWADDDQPVPAYDSGITLPVETLRKPPPPKITQVISDETVLTRNSDNTLRIQAAVFYDYATGRGYMPIGGVEVQFKPSAISDSAWDTTPFMPINSPAYALVSGVHQGVSYDFRARVQSTQGAVSDWSDVVSSVIVGLSSPPPPVTTFYVAEGPDLTRQYYWTIDNAPIDVVGVHIRYKAGSHAGDAWDSFLALHGGIISESPWESQLPPGGLYTFAIKSVDSSGNESDAAIYFVATLHDLPDPQIFKLTDDYPLGWPGSKTDCQVVSDGRLEFLESYQWDDKAAWDGWNHWYGDSGTLIYEHSALDLGRVMPFRPYALVVADPLFASAGGAVTIEYKFKSASGDSYSSWTAYDPAVAQVGRYIVFRISAVATDAIFPRFLNFYAGVAAAEVSESIIDLDTSTLSGDYRLGTGDIRLPITRPFTQINTVFVSFQTTDRVAHIADKDANVGPEVKITDLAGSAQDAIIDALVSGFI